MPADLSPQRKAVLDILRASKRPLGPQAVHKALPQGIASSYDSIKAMLPVMAKDGLVKREGQGAYVFVSYKTPSSGDGSTGPAPSSQSSSGVRTEVDLGKNIDGLPVPSDLVRIDSVNVRVSAGPGTEIEFEEIDGAVYMPSYLAYETFGVPADRVKRLTVTGTSMEPTLYAGQRVFVVLMDGSEEPAHGGIYVLRSPHGVLIKRLFFDTEAQGAKKARQHYVRVHSDNPVAGTIRLPLDVFRMDYAVVAHLRVVQTAL